MLCFIGIYASPSQVFVYEQSVWYFPVHIILIDHFYNAYWTAALFIDIFDDLPTIIVYFI